MFVVSFQPTCDPRISIDQDVINKRISELDAILQSTKYSKQKQSLKIELQTFLKSLPSEKDLHTAKPLDIRMFIVNKDSTGKTKVHLATCMHKGHVGMLQCGCPLRRSAGSVDSLIGQIRAIFRDSGYGTEWNEQFGIGNPAAAPLIKKHLHAIRFEQSSSAVIPKKAIPLFMDKLSMVLRYISYCLCNPGLSLNQQFILHRDKTFFNLLPYTGDRAGDLGRLLTASIKWLPNEDGLLLSLFVGKTIDLRDPRVMIVLKSHSSEFCPVSTLMTYLNFSKMHNVNLQPGYFFRPLNCIKKEIIDKPFTSSSVNARLKYYLKKLHIWDGETPHSTRSGCALTMLWLGIDDQSIKSHVGWKTDTMLKHYTSADTLFTKHVTASTLSKSNILASVQGKIEQYKYVTSFKPIV